MRRAVRWLAIGGAAMAGVYSVHAAVAWLRYGHVPPPAHEEVDPLLDRFMPRYDIAERHHVHVRAPAAITLAAACEVDPMSSPVARTIFTARELLLGSDPDRRRARAACWR